MNFRLGEKLSHDEDRQLEFKEVLGPNPVRSILEVADEYAVAFLNSEGGRILWGIRDSDKVVVGIALTEAERDRLRRDISSKLSEIQPQIDPTRFRVAIHDVTQGASNLSIVELVVPAGDARTPYFTASHICHVRIDGAKRKLTGQQLTNWILTRAGNILPPGSGDKVDPSLLSLAQRVRKIFAGHGLQPSHLSRFLGLRKAGFSITLADQQNDASFLRWLNEEKISWIANTFGVRREWIDGEDECVFEPCCYDKRPREFLAEISKHVDGLIFQEILASPEAWFIRNGVGKEWGRKGNCGVFVVIRVPLARLSNETTIYRYLSDFEPYCWVEGRTAVQLRAWARLLSVTKNIYCIGRELDTETSDRVESNLLFLHEVLESHELMKHCRDDWHPEDSSLFPEESMVAKPDPFFPHMLEFLKSHGLEEETRVRPLGARVPP